MDRRFGRDQLAQLGEHPPSNTAIRPRKHVSNNEHQRHRPREETIQCGPQHRRVRVGEETGWKGKNRTDDPNQVWTRENLNESLFPLA